MIFKKTKGLELQMDAFLDKISEAGIIYRRGIKAYMKDSIEDFDRYLDQITTLEHEADELRKNIETRLYTQTLVPESRGDILALMETSDDVIGRAKDTLVELSIEKPEVPDEFKAGFVELAKSIVLFLFASKGLEAWLLAHNLPTIPLVPVSSSQVVIGSVLGIGIAHGGRGIQFKALGKIASGWITTPVIAAVISFISLFFLQNVFDQQVVKPSEMFGHHQIVTIENQKSG